MMKLGQPKFKFKWIELMTEYNLSQNNNLSENAKYYINLFINKYEINLSSYLNYLNC